jgi:hypothetical protein
METCSTEEHLIQSMIIGIRSAALPCAERQIEWLPNQLVVSLDPSTHVATTADGGSIAHDLFLGVSVHVAPEVVRHSGMCVDGWIRGVGDHRPHDHPKS